MLRLMKSNACVLSLNILHINYKAITIHVNQLILTPFSPFDNKYKKKLIQKASGNAFS